jgi:hypothetical protein
MGMLALKRRTLGLAWLLATAITLLNVGMLALPLLK